MRASSFRAAKPVIVRRCGGVGLGPMPGGRGAVSRAALYRSLRGAPQDTRPAEWLFVVPSWRRRLLPTVRLAPCSAVAAFESSRSGTGGRALT
ncbi:hypothetical protein MRX96_024319 [Rhipicephalus microplus]